MAYSMRLGWGGILPEEQLPQPSGGWFPGMVALEVLKVLVDKRQQIASQMVEIGIDRAGDFTARLGSKVIDRELDFYFRPRR